MACALISSINLIGGTRQEMRHALSVLGEDTSRQVHHVYWRDFVTAFAEVRVPTYECARPFETDPPACLRSLTFATCSVA